jgi:hypothetical protein
MRRKHKINRGELKIKREAERANAKIKSEPLKIEPMRIGERVKLSATHPFYPNARALVLNFNADKATLVLVNKGRALINVYREDIVRTISWDENALLIEQRTLASEPKRVFEFVGGLLTAV